MRAEHFAKVASWEPHQDHGGKLITLQMLLSRSQVDATGIGIERLVFLQNIEHKGQTASERGKLDVIS